MTLETYQKLEKASVSSICNFLAGEYGYHVKYEAAPRPDVSSRFWYSVECRPTFEMGRDYIFAESQYRDLFRERFLKAIRHRFNIQLPIQPPNPE
jgi:hypothetical protein